MFDDFEFCETVIYAIKSREWETGETFANLGYVIDSVFDSDPWLVKKFGNFISMKIDEVNEAMKEITVE